MSYKKINETKVYKLVFDLAMKIFEISKRFPKEETYSLTDQGKKVRQKHLFLFSGSTQKRFYPAHFVSKISDADMENTETQSWLEFVLACKYITPNKYNELLHLSEEVGNLLNHMIKNPEKYK